MAYKLNQIISDSLLKASGADLDLQLANLRNNVPKGEATFKDLYSAPASPKRTIVAGHRARGPGRIEDDLRDSPKGCPDGLRYEYDLLPRAAGW